MLDLRHTLETLNGLRTDELVLSTFAASVLWEHISQRPDIDLPFWGPMGKASSTGLGIALALPHQRVWAFDGDGSLLMNLGSLVTIAAMRPPNLVHFVMDNRVYLTTGGQPIPGAELVNFPEIARGSGLTKVYAFDNDDDFRREIPGVVREEGPVFVDLRVKVGPLPGRVPRRTMRMAVHEFMRNVQALATAKVA
jgi:thiamine pyrophosphate-dependent acetolactate synthase large subunit-like protein